MADGEKRRGLGRGRKVYRGRPASLTDLLLWVLPGSLLPLIFAVYGAFLRWEGAASGVRRETAADLWFAFAFVSLIPFAGLTLLRFRTARASVVLYENGLRFKNIPGAPKGLLWEHVASVRTDGSRYHLFGIPVSDRLHLEIISAGGDRIRLPTYLQDLPELAETIRQNVYPGLLDSLTEDVLSGKQVRAGSVSFDRRSLVVRDRSIPWPDVTRLQVEAGHLIIETTAGLRKRIPTREIQNVELLLEIVEKQIDRPHQTAGSPA